MPDIIKISIDNDRRHFLEGQRFDITSMEDIATIAAKEKRTLYKVRSEIFGNQKLIFLPSSRRRRRLLRLLPHFVLPSPFWLLRPFWRGLRRAFRAFPAGSFPNPVARCRPSRRQRRGGSLCG